MDEKQYDVIEEDYSHAIVRFKGEETNKTFLRIKIYLQKYSGIFDSSGQTTNACRHGNLIAIKRQGRNEYNNAPTNHWYILDIHPLEHPGCQEYLDRVRENLNCGEKLDLKFDKHAPILLKRFNEARVLVSHTRFHLAELKKMLKVDKYRIKRWSVYGVPGYGKLPVCKFPKDRMRMWDVKTGHYRTGASGTEDYYETKDIVRFFSKELSDPHKRFISVDDALSSTNIEEIAAEEGWYQFHHSKVYPMNLRGFLDWATKSIFIPDKGTRRMLPFQPNDKQLEFYKYAFELKPDGTLKHKVICASRPRGDYKSFDITLLFLFRFFNLPEQTIFLVTNTVDQTSHLLYREAVKIIKRSPVLRDTPGLDIQKIGIYLLSGKGKENIFSQIEMISAEGGARSNADCFACSEVWKLQDETSIAEIEQSIRGVDNGWFLAESTVAPKGHFFHRYYTDYLTGENTILYFQYYDGSERRNPKIDENYLKHVRRIWPFHFKMFFDNRWEDAATGMFPEARIIEMNVAKFNGTYIRSEELVTHLDSIVSLNTDIRKLSGAADVSAHRVRLQELKSEIEPVDNIYTLPAPANVIEKLSAIYDCDFFIGMGLDRAKLIHKHTDRTVLVTVARGVLNSDRWGTDRIFFVLDVWLAPDATDRVIEEKMITNCDTYGGGIAYADLEDYNVLGIKEYVADAGIYAEITPLSFKYQEQIFTELFNATDDGYLKCPALPVWVDRDDNVHMGYPPTGQYDLLRSEMSVFESQSPINSGGKGSKGYFGSPFKKKTGRTQVGEQKDDTVYALAHAIHASIRGDLPAQVRKNLFARADIETNVYGNYGRQIRTIDF